MWGCFAFSETGASQRMNYTPTKEKRRSILQRPSPFWLEIMWKRIHFPVGQWPLNLQRHCARSVWSPRKSKECWRACLSLHSHKTSAPAEHLWEYLKRQKVKATVTSQYSLWDVLKGTACIICIFIDFQKLASGSESWWTHSDVFYLYYRLWKGTYIYR